MDGQWAVVVGAALGASGAVVGAFTTWVSARLQTRVQLKVAELQHTAAQTAETIGRKRAACSELVLSVDSVRRQMRKVRRHLQEASDDDPVLRTEQAAVHERIREAQAAEWVLRLMLSDEEQLTVTELTDAMYASHEALMADVDAWLAAARPGERREPSDAPRFGGTTAELQARMMSFASSAHKRLYSDSLPGTAPPAARIEPRTET
ncbi:hypothetical protein ABZ771_12215 [Streptomyces globisporus]|uniref:hypothetical protein n=1 Tax=Streptomyces globisporus TaxID=1908 RepID=UPI000E2AB33B|nr:hypothetical protein [Streptomyces sp. HB202]RDL01355.1 hypothetical protein DER30_7160 [Streptomyces sp. HB202]WSF78512.1 hypothetical protein OG838_21385 [Streptomyces globisporus]